MAKLIRKAIKAGMTIGGMILMKEDIKRFLRVGMKLARVSVSEGEKELRKALKLSKVESKHQREIMGKIMKEARVEKSRLMKVAQKEMKTR